MRPTPEGPDDGGGGLPPLPDYWLERPRLRLDPDGRAAVEELLAAVSQGRTGGPPIDLDPILPGASAVPLWQLLCAVGERRTLAFHGTGDPRIASFEPRRPLDFAPFGDREAVFATTDPIWAMYYAVVDRDRYALTRNNGCLVLLDAEGRDCERYYYFSVSRGALPRRPWRTGYLYLLPADGFVAQPPATYAGRPARVPQLASPVAVRPLARLRVAPRDFPFLGQVRGHDDERLGEYARAVMGAAPWPD